MESQVIRFKTAAETAERSEEELKTERRKMQREVTMIIYNALGLIEVNLILNGFYTT